MANIALVFGGPSLEHEVSQVSAKYILTILQKMGKNVLPIGISKNKVWKVVKPEDLLRVTFMQPLDLDNLGTEVCLINRQGANLAIDTRGQPVGPTINLVFPICHGPFGEDGRLQGFFDLLGLPYVGSGTKSCALSLDKVLTKAVIAQVGIPQLPFMYTTKQNMSIDEVLEKLNFPLFVKPSNMGSSVGISKVKKREEWSPALEKAFAIDPKIIIEQGVRVREVEVAVMERAGRIQVSDTGEITPTHEFYSYESKYLDPNGAHFTYPANIGAAAAQRIKDYAATAFTALECRGYARIDFFVTADDQVYFNELNTHPGFTPISQFPILWQKAGLSETEIMASLLMTAAKQL